MGAGKVSRITDGVKAASLCGFVVSGVLFVILLLFGRQLSLLFMDTPNEQMLDYSYQLMMTTAGGYCLLTLVNVVRFSIQGMGYSVFAIISGVMEMLARGLAGLVLVPFFGFTGVCFGHVLAWIFADSFLIPAFFFCRKKLERQLGVQ